MKSAKRKSNALFTKERFQHFRKQFSALLCYSSPNLHDSSNWEKSTNSYKYNLNVHTLKVPKSQSLTKFAFNSFSKHGLNDQIFHWDDPISCNDSCSTIWAGPTSIIDSQYLGKFAFNIFLVYIILSLDDWKCVFSIYYMFTIWYKVFSWNEPN